MPNSKHTSPPPFASPLLRRLPAFGVPLVGMLLSALLAVPATAQYNLGAGQNSPKKAYAPMVSAEGEVMRDRRGQVRFKEADHAPAQNKHGNVQGNQYDLAVDGAFNGQTVLIIDQVGNSLSNTKKSLATKGFSTVVYSRGVPSVKVLTEDLKKSAQVWLISTSTAQLKDGHIKAIKKFFDAGHGVYIWGDNDPLYADANRLSNALVPGLGMKGNLYGNQVVGLSNKGSVGVRQGHLVTTGLEHLYEGVTIATVHFDGSHKSSQRDKRYNTAEVKQVSRHWGTQVPQGFTPLLYGSTGNLVSVAYNANGKRLVMDGGFTRLAVNWDDAGTARFVKNAASWLVNAERFGDKVARTSPKK